MGIPKLVNIGIYLNPRFSYRWEKLSNMIIYTSINLRMTRITISNLHLIYKKNLAIFK